MGQAMPLGKPAMLIVEDEAIIRHDLVDYFTDEGFDVFDAQDADQAIAQMQANPAIRIVLTDVNMPGSMDGVRLAHFIRDRYPPTTLVIASGEARPTADEIPAGAVFFPKPFDPRSILDIIRDSQQDQ